jgi:uncharacterized membrane protein YeaQ/YmgE (transglycosylase-associated protein family)
MTLELFGIWVIVGVAAGGLAGYFVQGGYGLIGDIAFGLAGSLLGSLVFSALGISPDAGLVALLVVTFLGAAFLIGAERLLWHATA